MTSTVLPVAFDRILDDAAIFPPGNAPMADAVRRHRTYRDSPMIGTFVCSLARLPELDALLDEPLDVSVVIPAGRFELTPTRRVRIAGIERHALAEGDGPDVPTYVEFPELPRFPDELLRSVPSVKFRTGGVTADAFPTEERLAGAIIAAVMANVPFKCTAGLHNAVRHTSVEGFEQHGFLNVLLATAATHEAGPVQKILAERDGAVLASLLRELAADDIVRARRSFRSFGTCSIAEPLLDLHQLGLLA